MPDTPSFLVPLGPATKVRNIAKADGLPDDIADDFLRVTGGIESGSRHYNRKGRVLLSPADPKDGQRAVGFSQIKPATAKSVGVDDVYDEAENIKAGLRYFAKGGDDPVRRRIAYFSGTNSRAAKYYDRTGKIPKGGDFTGTSFDKYVKASGGLNQSKDDKQRSDGQPSFLVPLGKPNVTSKPPDKPFIVPLESTHAQTATLPEKQAAVSGPAAPLPQSSPRPIGKFAGLQAGAGGQAPESGMGAFRQQVEDPTMAQRHRIEADVTKSTPRIFETKNPADIVNERITAENVDNTERQRQQAERRKQQPEIDRLAKEYRKAIRISAAGRPGQQWFSEVGAQGAAQLGAKLAGELKTSLGGKLLPDGLGGSVDLHAKALQQAAEAEGADRNTASRWAQGVAAGFIGSAPELAAMSAGVPAPVAFGVGSGLSAAGRDEAMLPAMAHSALTGAAFELGGTGGSVGQVARKAGTVGAATTGIELASGQSLGEALKSGATNAALVGVPGLANVRKMRLKEGVENAQRDSSVPVTPEVRVPDPQAQSEVPTPARADNLAQESVRDVSRQKEQVNARQTNPQREGVQAEESTQRPLEPVGQDVQNASVEQVGEAAGSESQPVRHVAQAPTKQAEIVKPWEMPREQVEESFQRKKAGDSNLEVTILGPELAKRYERLQRTANSSTATRERSDAASAEIEKIEAALSERDRNRLYGIGETEPQVDQWRDYRQSLGNLDDSNPQALAESMRWAISKVGRKTDPSKMTHEQQVAYGTLREAARIAHENGWDTQAISREAVKAAAGRYSDPEDAAFMLDRFIKKETKPENPRSSHALLQARVQRGPNAGDFKKETRAQREARQAQVAQGGQVEKPQPPARVNPATLTQEVKSEPDYAYHATNEERLFDIANEGKMRTNRPHEFTDQEEWPDGSTEKRAYFSKDAATTWQFSPEEGRPVVIRTKQGEHIRSESYTGDLYSKKPINADQLEYLGDDNNWHPVKNLAETPTETIIPTSGPEAPATPAATPPLKAEGVSDTTPTPSTPARREFILPKGGEVNQPLAAKGLTSYRYRTDRGGHIAIGAKGDADALNQAGRSLSSEKPDIAKLDVWDGEKYVSVAPKDVDSTLPTPSTPEPSSTSAKRASVTADRAGRGLEPIPKPERKPDDVLLEQAKAANDANPSKPSRLADEVLTSPRALSDVETVQLDLHRQKLKNDYNELAKKIDAETDPEAIKRLGAEADAIEREGEKVENAWATSGTEKGRALRSQRIEVDQDMNLLEMVVKRKQAVNRDLTDAERATIKQQHDEIADLRVKLEEADTRTAQLQAEKSVSQIKREIVSENRKAGSRAKKQTLDDEAAQLKQLIAAAWKKTRNSQGTQPAGLAGLDPEGEITKLVLKLVHNRVKANIGIKAGDLVNDVHNFLKDVVDTDPRTIRDMISGYGRQRGTRSDIQKQMDALKSELFKVSSEEDIAAGSRSSRREGPRLREGFRQTEGPKLSEGRGRREGPRLSESTERKAGPRLTDAPVQGPRLSEGTGRKAGPRITDAPLQGPKLREGWRSTEGPRLSEGTTGRKEGPRLTDASKVGPRDTAPALRNRIEKQIADLQVKLDSGDFSKAERRGPTVYDAHTLALQKRLETIKRDYAKANYRAIRGRGGIIRDDLAKAANIPKTIKSMGDLSAVLRQGGYGFITHPIEGGLKPTRDMIRSFSEAGYRNVENAIKHDPSFEASKRDGVEYTGVNRADPSLSHREEGYLGQDLLDYVPVARQVGRFSERTFTSFLDSQRLHLYKTLTEGLTDPNLISRTLGAKRGVTRAANPAEFQRIARAINSATGRGNLGRYNQAAPLLNSFMFSPRLLKSRVELLNNMFNPVAVARMPRNARAQIIKDNVKFLAATAAVMELAKAAGGTVNTDPDDADFLKIRFGDTTYDTLTGLQQPLRYIINMTRASAGDAMRLGGGIASGFGLAPNRVGGYLDRKGTERNETFEGKEKGELTGRFARSKLSPLAGTAVDYLAGEDFQGRQFNAKRAALDTVTPLPVKDFVEAMQREGLVKGAVKASPTLLGIGTQTYEAAEPKTKAEKLARKFKLENIPKKPRTADEVDLGRKVGELKAKARKGEDVADEIADLEGQISDKQAKDILKSANLTGFQADFKRLTPKQALIVYKVADADKRTEVKDMLEHKVSDLGRYTDAEQADLIRRMKEIGMVAELPGQKKLKPQKAPEPQKPQKPTKQSWVFQ